MLRKHCLLPAALIAGMLLIAFGSVSSRAADTLGAIEQRGFLRWGSDAEGGAPYVFPDPHNPARLIGFEVDLAAALAREMGVAAKQTQNAWDSLIPALMRGDCDIVLNGIEVTEERGKKVLFSRPYYIYTEQLVVRKEENTIRGVGDLRDKKAGTLSGSVAQNILGGIGGVNIRIYTGQAEPYEDLASGRLDAVLLDLPIAAYYALPNPKLKYAGPPVGEGQYAIALRKGDEALLTRVDGALAKLLATGELQRIYEKWDLWNPSQAKLMPRQGRVKGKENKEEAVTLKEGMAVPVWRFLPTLLWGAGMTIVISVTSMALAVTLGLFLILVRLYGPSPVCRLATAYIEIYRGTPLLIQLYILYYGSITAFPNIGIAMSPLLAAFLGLGMNYAAYEAEIYRAGVGAVPRGQMEAASALGMSRNLALRRIILPQGLRVSLPGITNDFIALFKDSSLVSVIALVELTKTYNILAASTLRFFELGLITAVLYFAMSYPLSLLARRLERRLSGGKGS